VLHRIATYQEADQVLNHNRCLAVVGFFQVLIARRFVKRLFSSNFEGL
jgi:hypothetical protein